MGKGAGGRNDRPALAMFENGKSPHLGIPLYSAQFPAKPFVGYRYWAIDEKGRLGAPIGGGHMWVPGLNKAECRNNKHCNIGRNCGCGLYAWPHTGGKGICNKTYFDPTTATVNNSMGSSANTVMGAVVLFKAVTLPNGMLRAKYGVVTGLSLPPNPSKELRKRVERSAKLYKIDITKPYDLHDEALEYVDTKLGQFATKRPLDWVYDLPEDTYHTYQSAPVDILQNLWTPKKATVCSSFPSCPHDRYAWHDSVPDRPARQ